MNYIIVIIVLIVIAYIGLKFDNDDDDVERPRLFDVPLDYLLRPPKEGYRCSGCWDEFREDIKVCPDCNKEIVDFAKTEFIDWKFDYDAMDKHGFIYDDEDLDSRLNKLKENKESALIVFGALMKAYMAYFNENMSADKKRKAIEDFTKIQDEICNQGQ